MKMSVGNEKNNLRFISIVLIIIAFCYLLLGIYWFIVAGTLQCYGCPEFQWTTQEIFIFIFAVILPDIILWSIAIFLLFKSKKKE
jgi:hypothetical protein